MAQGTTSDNNTQMASPQLLMTPEDFERLSNDRKDEYYRQIYSLVGAFSFQRPTNVLGSNTSSYTKRPQKVFEAKTIPEKATNLIIGSSILADIEHTEMPGDVCIHSYNGSRVSEKYETLQKYDTRELKSVTIQDGTNSLTRELDLNVLTSSAKQLN